MQLKVSSIGTILSGAKCLRSALLIVYACLFVWQVKYMSEGITSDAIGLGLEVPASSSSSFTVDILSVATINRTDLLEAQERTFASHPSVRNFFNVTELDDHDPTCYKELTFDHVYKVSNFCRFGTTRNHGSKVMKCEFAESFAHVDMLSSLIFL